MPINTEAEIINRLDKILRILAVQVSMERSMTEAVYLLGLADLDNNTIAEVLNTSPATVRALKSDIRKQPTVVAARKRGER